MLESNPFPGSVFFEGRREILEFGLKWRNTPNGVLPPAALTQHSPRHFPILILSLLSWYLLNIAFRKLQHIVPLLHVWCLEGELSQTKISNLGNTAGTAIGASLKTGRGAVTLHTVYLCYPSSSFPTPACAARRALWWSISSLGFQVGHVDLPVDPLEQELNKFTFNFNLRGKTAN